ncbi:MAG TPA: glucodextranase DOMON-like domain-containing protein [Chloroflexota bacterium]
MGIARRLCIVVLVGSLGLSTFVAVRPGVTLAAGLAADGPGALSHFDLARKDCLGTTRNSTSKVWYTVANGVLSDVYYPTIDNTNVETLQYIVSDGSSFTDLQTRDMTYTVQPLNNRALDCRVISSARSGKYQIVTDYVTDPAHNTVVMQSRFQPLVGDVSNYHLYVRYDPSINGNGGGGSGNGGGDSGAVNTSLGHTILIASDLNTSSYAANRTYAVPVYSALDASTPFLQARNGFVGQSSDGLVQLDSVHSLTTSYDGAANGNLVQTAQLDLSHGGNTFTLALGFGNSQANASAAAEGSLALGAKSIEGSFEAGWQAYDAALNSPPASFKGVTGATWGALANQYYYSANVLKASEDKTFPGALVASLASPWGQAISAGDPSNLFFGSYREVFARDLYETWSGLMADGDLETARDAVNFLFTSQQRPDGSMPRNSLLNGQLAPDSFGTQLDEASYPIIMADQMGMADSTLYQNHIKPAANFVMSHGPAFGVERWEEQGGYSPSTISAEIAGLIAAADIATVNGDAQSAAVWRGVADDWQRSIEGWDVTTNGPLANHPYYIRLSKTGDPNAAISYNVGNGGPTLDQRTIMDAGFLELVRLGLKPASDPTIGESMPVVDATIESSTANGPGWHRYNGDGYGDGAGDGHPWAPSGNGTGHLWPALAGERAEYDLANGDASTAMSLLDTMRRMASDVGLIPEQNWELPDLAASPYGTDPTTASIGFQNGHPAGSAAPLTWSMAQYVRLFHDVLANKITEQPTSTFNRYVAHQQGETSLTVSAPADQSSISGSPLTVSGTSVAGNTIYVSATNTDANSQTTTVNTTTDSNGDWSTTVPVTGGTTVLNIVAVSASGGTAHVLRTVVFDFTPGTVLFDTTDVSNDDNGPGNYAYPTASDFHAGAFDMQRFQVIESLDGQTTTFKLQTRDLTPTFGSPLGAQLVDVYVHTTDGAASSTSAAYTSRNYSIAPASAWSRLVEVQGFGQRYVDAQGNTLGTVNISANSISRYITFSVRTSTLGGTPGSGWGFTVVLTGQDGFSSDQARSFTSTPGNYTFGVCATSSTDAHCTVDPNSVPKAMDVLTPSGVNQSTELDYTLGPVILQEVVIP